MVFGAACRAPQRQAAPRSRRAAGDRESRRHPPGAGRRQPGPLSQPPPRPAVPPGTGGPPWPCSARAFLTIAAATEHTSPPPEDQIPLTRNEIAALFSTLIIDPLKDARHRLQWDCNFNGVTLTNRETLVTDVTAGPDEGPVLAAADEQLLRELTERARTGGLKLTGEGGLLGKLTKMVVEGALEGELDDHLWLWQE